MLVTYDVSRLMRISGDRRFLVTLGGRGRVDPGSVIAEMTYSHPLYTAQSIVAQRLLPTLDDDRVAFAGAYHGWGFHEDGAAVGAAGRAIPGRGLACALDTDGGDGKLTTAIYRTTVTHDRQAPVRHSFEYRSYSWYIDLDDLPTLPWWLRPFARFDARDHLAGRPGDSLRDRVDAYLSRAWRGECLTAGSPRCCRRGCWVTCSIRSASSGATTATGSCTQVIVEVHNTYGQRHAYLLPPVQRTGTGRQEVVRVSVQPGVRPLPGPGAAARRKGGRGGVAARRRAVRPSSRHCAGPGGRRPSAMWRGCRSWRRWPR